MQRVITSNNITFMDTSDERKLEVSVESNLPTSQIYNSNIDAYSPDWTANNLVLEACATLDLIDITQDENTVITWSKKNGTGEVQSVGTGYQLTISTNELSNTSGIITYICTATYDGLASSSQIVFTRVDTGINATTYEVLCSSYTIVRNSSNTYVPSTLTIEGQKQVGNNSPTKYPCRFKIEETTDMSTWTSKYESSVDEDTITHTPSVGIKAIKCSMYKAGGTSTLLDYQTIPIVSDGNGGSDAYSVALSNESYIFAELGTTDISRTVTINVLAYKGRNKVAAEIGTITTAMPTGMTVTISNNNTTSAKFSVKITKEMTRDSGGFNVPIIVDGITFNKRFTYALAKKGDNGITFQIYGEQGLVLTEDAPETTLKVFAYDGDTAITNATYKWYYQDNVEVINEEDGSAAITTKWTKIDGATTGSYKVTKRDIFRAASYKCEMTYKGKTYYETVVVQDKNDIYNALINVHEVIKTSNGQCYWVLSASIYSEKGEMDRLLGDVLRTAPDNTITEQEGASEYYYHVDIDSETPTVTLKHYNGTEWEDSTIGQTYNYMWDIIDYKDIANLKYNKVKIISSNDFTNTINVICNVSDEDGVQARAAISLTDTSDPIVSQTEPLKPEEGQIWIIKNNNDEDYVIKTYTNGQWVNINKKCTVYRSRPSIYNQGDFWITNSNTDYEDADNDKDRYPYLQGTLLVATSGNSQYNCDDWILASAKEDLSSLKTSVENLYQYISTDPIEGLVITGMDSEGNKSGYSSNFKSDKLSFNYKGKEKLVITTNGISTPQAIVENGLSVTNGPITLNSLNIKKESNGSYSFII